MGNCATQDEMTDPGRSSLDREERARFDVGSRKKWPSQAPGTPERGVRGRERYPATRRATTKP